MPDPELAAEISRALARDPRTAGEHIGVYPMLGRVRLRGAVHTVAAREAAERLATAIPGVGEVVNELHVSADANVLPVMASVTNTEDVVPGGR
jgi:osmotically-inducible protein OsmY